MKLFDDTGPEAERVYIELMSQTPVWKKVRIIDDLYLTAVSIVTSSIRRRYPGINQSESKKRIAEIFLGKNISWRIYDT